MFFTINCFYLMRRRSSDQLFMQNLDGFNEIGACSYLIKLVNKNRNIILH